MKKADIEAELSKYKGFASAEELTLDLEAISNGITQMQAQVALTEKNLESNKAKLNQLLGERRYVQRLLEAHKGD